ncbi:MAG: molybdopterin-guanine dinucleotide biosynthesis protein B [Chloroflexi bacterium]|nr:molybdopterin-guanine dinucleotide biosynthesis protein B [Chloroflexota bacterium]
MIPVVAFVGASGSGKTTVLEGVVGELKAQGLRIGVAKHSHHEVQLDQPGKDTWRLAEAGCDVVVLGTQRGLTMFDRSGEDTPLEAVAALVRGRVDLLLAEGYGDAAVPKVAVVRRAVSSDLPDDRENLIALVSDVPFALPLPRFSFDEPRALADFLVGFCCHQAETH